MKQRIIKKLNELTNQNEILFCLNQDKSKNNEYLFNDIFKKFNIMWFELILDNHKLSFINENDLSTIIDYIKSDINNVYLYIKNNNLYQINKDNISLLINDFDFNNLDETLKNIYNFEYQNIKVFKIDNKEHYSWKLEANSIGQKIFNY